MDVKLGGSIYNVMLAMRPDGTHLTDSKVPGGKSALARDDEDNALVTHAVMFDVGLVVAGVTVAVMAAGAVAPQIPHIKSGLARLTSKLRSRKGETADVEGTAPSATIAQNDPDEPEPPRLRAV